MNQISNLFRRNLLAKILAFVGAIFLWLFVMNEQNPTINNTFTVPIIITNQPEDVKVVMDRGEVKLKVRATRSLMASYNIEDFKAYVDLTGTKSGKNNLKIYTVIPSGFELLEMSEDTVNVNIDAMVQKYVPIDISVNGNTPAGLTAESLKPETTQASIYGPEQLVDTVVKAMGFINITNNNTDFTVPVHLVPVNDKGKNVEGVDVRPNEVNTTVKINMAMTKKSLEVKPAVSGNLPDNLQIGSIKASPARVDVTGPGDVLNALNSINTLQIQLDNTRGTSSQEVQLNLPEGVTTATPKVTVTITLKQKK